MTRTAPLMLAAILFLAAPALADEVVLTSGRTIAGRVVKEDDSEVTIEVKGGKLKFPRSQVKEVRKGPVPEGTGEAPPPKAPAPRDPPRSTPKPDAPPASAGAAKPPASEHRKGPATPQDLLAELESIALHAWSDAPSTRCDGDAAKAYKIVRDDGTTLLRDDRPMTPGGVAELYVRNDADYGQRIELVNGVRTFYWYRLFWSAKDGVWKVVSPELEEFQRECALAQRIADAACKDENFRIAACCDESSLGNALRADPSSSAAKERAKLREDCAKAMGSDDGGEALARFHELEIEIARAKQASQKISLARERRGVLRRLVDLSKAK